MKKDITFVKKFLFMILIFGMLPLGAFGQRRVNYEVLPWQQRNVVASSDTLWVLPRKDVLKLYSMADSYETKDTKVKELVSLANKLKTQVNEKDKVIEIHKEVTASHESDKKAAEDYIKTLVGVNQRQKTEIKKLKMHRNIAIGGAAVALIIGLVL